MKILAIDSSSVVATVALTDESKIIAEYSVNHKKTHSQTLLPMIDEIVKMSEININELDAIAAVALGGTSMTGGRGNYEYTFSRYEQAPSDVQEKEIAARAQEA